MNTAVAIGRQATIGQSKFVANALVHSVPLAFLKYGEVATIVKVRGKGDLQHHLENLGFVEGALVKVVSESAGDLIVDIKGTQVALNRQVAQRILTAAA